MQQRISGLWLISLVALAGCSSSPLEGTEAPSSGTEAGRILTPQLEVTGSAKGEVVLRDEGPQGIQLVVVDFGEGTLAMAVGGPISTSASFADGGTIAEIHRALHPEETALPESIVSLSERFDALQRASAHARTVEPMDDSAVTTKSLSTFKSTVCRSFTEISYRWDPLQCVFRNDSGGLFPAGPFAWSGERTYGWNNNAHTAVLQWFGRCSPNAGCYPDPAYYAWTLPNYWWTWTSIVRSTWPYSFDVDLDSKDYSSPKELGLTEHQAVINVK